MADPGRLITAMVTPFQANDFVDYSQAKALALALLDSGSDGLVIAGTTGESPTLVKDEKLRLFAEIKDAVGERGAVIAGTGSNSTAATIDLTRAAEQTGVDGALLVVPYYNKPTQEGLYRHFKAVAESTSLPCILYNVPSRTVTNLSAETVIRLSEVPNIIGVKEASGDLDQIGAIIDGTHAGFRVWSGDDASTYAIMRRGGYGVVAVASHLAGGQIKEMIRLLVEGDVDQAAAIDGKLAPLYRGLFIISNPIPVKHALNYIGFRVGGCRLPLTDADPASTEAIEAVLREVTVDLPIPSAN